MVTLAAPKCIKPKQGAVRLQHITDRSTEFCHVRDPDGVERVGPVFGGQDLSQGPHNIVSGVIS